jgi:hypothetical protein
MSKGEHRCCFLDLEKLGYVTGIDGSNASRIIHELEEKPGLIKVLRFTEGRIGAPKSQKILLAPIITTEDRTKATVERILAEADTAKRADMDRRAAAERRRYRERNPNRPDRHGDDQKDDPVVTATVRNSDSRDNGQTMVSDPNGDFSDRCGDCLLNHIDKPQEEVGRPGSEASPLQATPPNGKPGWLPMLNPDAAARKAFAVSQVTVSKTGKVTIGPEFRAALREDFTDSQIDRGLEKAARYMEGGPEKRIASVRTACGWAKEDDRKQSAAGKLQSARRTFAR